MTKNIHSDYSNSPWMPHYMWDAHHNCPPTEEMRNAFEMLAEIAGALDQLQGDASSMDEYLMHEIYENSDEHQKQLEDAGAYHIRWIAEQLSGTLKAAIQSVQLLGMQFGLNDEFKESFNKSRNKQTPRTFTYT